MSIKSALIIDDNEADRYLLKRDLEKIDFPGEIFEAENGQEAINFLENYEENKSKHTDKFPPFIIFLDINMPLVDGFEFLSLFSNLRQSKEEYKSIVFMMFTTSEIKEDKEKAFSYDFVKDYLIKGEYNFEHLKKIIFN
jgi:CheY-like chemotaxis protein